MPDEVVEQKPPQTIAEHLAANSSADAMVAAFKGEEVTAGNLIAVQKKLLNEYHPVIALSFVQHMEKLIQEVEAKLGKKQE